MCNSETDAAAFTNEMINSGLWISTGVQGVFGRSSVFEDIVLAFENLITDIGQSDGAKRVFFPPVTSRATVVQAGYLYSFPELCGSVHSFSGGEREHSAFTSSVDAGEDWSEHLQSTDVVLTPAACYPLYPTLTGQLGEGGGLYDLSSFVFRHEPSEDPARMQVFRQKENVRISNRQDVEEWRAGWMARSVELFEQLLIPVRLDVANDPFFGRGGKMLAINQVHAELKFEIMTSLFPDSGDTAIASFNYHEDKFGVAFDIRAADNSPAHTACFGFGLERVALALLRVHGLNPATWPSQVRSRLAI